MGIYGLSDLRVVKAPRVERSLAYENETLFLAIEYEPGYRGTPHTHTWATVYYITHGQGRTMVGGEWHEVGPGTLVMIPPDSMHCMESTTALGMIEVQCNCPQQFVDGILSR